jgi:hypothetical protein
MANLGQIGGLVSKARELIKNKKRPSMGGYMAKPAMRKSSASQSGNFMRRITGK